MTWIMSLPDGGTVESDDFLLSDLETIEKETGEYWSTMNVLRTAKVARAFLRVAYQRTGRDPADVDLLTMKFLKSCFDFRADDEAPAEAEGTAADPTKGRTSRSSSGGARRSTSGPRPSAGSND